jgi:GNAT superfamily N-acetyltransferase
MKQPTDPEQDACTVRRPRSGDYEAMAELAGQLGYPSTGPDVRRRLGEMRDSRQYAVYVAELANGRIAGWIGVYVFRAVELNGFVEISGLVVDERIRSRGIGKMLLDAAEGWARERGYEGISVRSNTKRERAHAFYRRNGFQGDKTQASLYKTF